MKRPHHHGNLREALITAGLDLLETGGPDALTLRKCAAQAGVSHAAPAHHFNGLVSLKAAIIARGHRIFTKSMVSSRDSSDGSPRGALQAVCAGYIAFAEQHTALFKFMFQGHDVDLGTINQSVLEELKRESSASYQVLRDVCAPFEHKGAGEEGTEVMIWSLVHGYAMLFCTPHRGASPSGSVLDFSEILPELRLKSDDADFFKKN